MQKKKKKKNVVIKILVSGNRAEPTQIPPCNSHRRRKRLRRCIRLLSPNQENPHHSSHQDNKAAEARSEPTGGIFKF